jgi:hypothetical protein
MSTEKAQPKPAEWAMKAARKLYLRFIYGTERKRSALDARDRSRIIVAARNIERLAGESKGSRKGGHEKATSAREGI